MEPNPSFTHTVPGLWLERQKAGRGREREDKGREGNEMGGGTLVCKVQAGYL